MIFLKKLHGNMIFSVYAVEMVFLFPNDITLPFCQNSKGNLLQKNTLKDEISGIIEKDYIHPRKHGNFFW